MKGIEPSLSAWEVDNGDFGVKDGAGDDRGKVCVTVIKRQANFDLSRDCVVDMFLGFRGFEQYSLGIPSLCDTHYGCGIELYFYDSHI